ncbi:MAG: thioredoxin [Candidatus Eisenbacteria bacterium]|nr:thioredoxin [Candidatus Eisenbacteria bacterium]
METWKPVAVDDKNFESEVLKSDIPVLVDFWAPWCAPCRMIAPVVEELAQEMKGKIKVGKINVDENALTASKYGVRGIPTLLLFKGGEIAAQKVGAASKVELVKMVEQALGS